MAASPTTIAGFELTVSDLERAVDFYTRGLGLIVRAREDHGHFQEVQLIGEGDTAALLLVSPQTPNGAPPIASGLVKVTIVADDVPGLYSAALNAGAESALAPQHHAPSDVWFAHVRDPDGYTVQLVQRRQRTEASTVAVTSPVEDHIAISELFNRFADALDRKEWNLLEDFYADNAVGEFKSRDPRMQPIVISGRENLIDFARRMIGSPEIVTQHLLGNFSARIEGGAAEATARMRGYHAGVGPRQGLFEESIGHYAGRFERTPDGWRCRWWEEDIYIMLGDPRLFAPELGDPGGTSK
jgi:predicted enzyme related to lactoylglutathione lyase